MGIIAKLLACLLLTTTAPLTDDDLGDVVVFCDHPNDPDTFEFFGEHAEDSPCFLNGGKDRWQLRLVIRRRRGGRGQIPDAYFNANKIAVLWNVAKRAGDDVTLLRLAPKCRSCVLRHFGASRTRSRMIIDRWLGGGSINKNAEPDGLAAV
jgi:hypothetical protein